jgi:hypothetical protein
MPKWLITLNHIIATQSTASGSAICTGMDPSLPKSKAGLWKGPFHVPRAQLLCSQIATELANGTTDK